MSDLDDELALDYLADCREHLAAVEADLLATEMGGADVDDERLGRVFHALHAVTGPAAYFELAKIRELAYQAENLVALIRSRKAAPTAEQVRALLRAADKLRELIQSPAASNQADIAQVLSGLARLQDGQPAGVRLSLAPDPAPRTDQATEPFDPAHPNALPLRILLVEDDFACRLLLQTFLARYGECHVAVNGKEAVDAFRAAIDLGQRYDLICMDIMMPEMDGREAVRQVRAIEEAKGIHSTFGAKIFMTTTVQEMKDVFLCFKELCDAYLMKPIDLGQLLDQMKFYRLLG
jgi:two-component system chemotaxis response regulator CheY